MRLYPKKLHSLKDLEREKRILLKEKKQLDKEELFSLKGVLGGKGAKDDDGDDEDEGGSMLDLLNFLPVSNPLVSMGIKLAQGWLAGRGKNKVEETFDKGKKKDKHILRTVAFEVIGGYLKWKAIQLSVKGVKHVIKKRKENKEAQGQP